MKEIVKENAFIAIVILVIACILDYFFNARNIELVRNILSASLFFVGYTIFLVLKEDYKNKKE